MIVEERIYTLFPGKVPEYLTCYEAEGMTIQAKYLPNMLGYYFTEVGPLNQVIHLWLHDNYEERLNNRNNMRADPQWQRYWEKIQPLVLSQENKFLRPASFFEKRLDKIVECLKSKI